MDKILLTAFLSALAGFITSVLSIVKLVNEKESKTTDYRQVWTDSVRKALGDLVGRLNAQAGHIAGAADTRKSLINLLREEESKLDESVKKRLADFAENSLKENQAAIRQLRREIYELYALTRLHFKPNDLSFNRIEQKFDIVMSMLVELGNSDDELKRATLKEKVHAITDEIAFFARDILKTEWETVKKGEPAYQLTKRWSIAGSAIMLFVLLSIGIHAGISIWRQSIAADQTESTSRLHPMQGAVPQLPTVPASSK